jgi:hypothetical protein
MVNKAQVTEKATTPHARRAWNTSTRPSARDDGTHHSDQQRGDKDPAVATKPGQSRCASPSCQRRRKAAAPVATARTHRDAVPLDGPHCQHQSPKANDPADPPAVSTANSTRAMIERAFDAAFVSTLEDASFTALDSSVDVSSRVETTPSPQQPIVEMLQKTDDAATQWRAHYVRQREQRQRAASKQLARDTKAAEFQRAMRAARVEYEQGKLAIQSLQARVRREVQFLQATATELSRRVRVPTYRGYRSRPRVSYECYRLIQESLLDDAFEGYEQWLRRELEREGERDSQNAHAG